MKQHPFAWVQRVAEELIGYDEVPLFGRAPTLNWEKLSSMLAHSFGIPSLNLAPKEQKWRTGDDIGAGLGSDLLVVPLTVSPFASPLYWAMGKKDREKFTSWMLNGKTRGRAFTSEILQEGYYRFLLLELLDAVHSLEPLKSFSLQLGDEAPLPEETAFCIDVELLFDGSGCWGRLILTQPFRKAWIQHFSAFPSEYVPRLLSQKLELVLGVKTGSAVLRQREWKSLREGDFLLLDSGSYDARRSKGIATLMLGPTPLFRIKIKENKIELVDYAFTTEDTMQEQKSAPPGNISEPLEEAKEEAVAIKDLPIHVTVELARVKMTLDHLMSLNPGNMLELPVHPDQGVSLTVSGQKVGRGELVYLGEALGVRILEIG